MERILQKGEFPKKHLDCVCMIKIYLKVIYLMKNYRKKHQHSWMIHGVIMKAFLNKFKINPINIYIKLYNWDEKSLILQ